MFYWPRSTCRPGPKRKINNKLSGTACWFSATQNKIQHTLHRYRVPQSQLYFPMYIPPSKSHSSPRSQGRVVFDMAAIRCWLWGPFWGAGTTRAAGLCCRPVLHLPWGHVKYSPCCRTEVVLSSPGTQHRAWQTPRTGQPTVFSDYIDSISVLRKDYRWAVHEKLVCFCTGESSLGDLTKPSAAQQSQMRAWKHELLECFLMSLWSKKLCASFLSQNT